MDRETRRRNWIGGEARPALSGRSFVPAGGKLAWAASEAADAEAAVVALTALAGPADPADPAGSGGSAGPAGAASSASAVGSATGSAAGAATGAAAGAAAAPHPTSGRAVGSGGAPGPGPCAAAWETGAGRSAALAQLVERLLENPDPGDATANLLGLLPAEVARSAAGRAKRWRSLAAAADATGATGATWAAAATGASGVPGVPGDSRGPSGLALVTVHWSAGIWEPIEAVLECLAAGRPTVLVTDPLLPSVGDALAAAAAGEGIAAGPVLPGRALAILHGDTGAALRRLMADGSVTHLVAARPVDSFARLAGAWGARPSFASSRPHGGFGAGVLEHAPRSAALTELKGRLICLGDEGQDRMDARRVLLEAFGRLEALFVRPHDPPLRGRRIGQQPERVTPPGRKTSPRRWREDRRQRALRHERQRAEPGQPFGSRRLRLLRLLRRLRGLVLVLARHPS